MAGNAYLAVAAKVRAMYGGRMTGEDYRQLMGKTTIPQAAAFLQSHRGYRRELAGLHPEGLHREQLENALRARDVYKNEYTLSKRSINDLLSVEQDVWSATSAKIMAEYDGWSSAINYASAVDNLMPLIGIEKNAAAKLPDLS